jgi:hypothetical protein
MTRPPETWVDPDGPGAAYVELLDVRPGKKSSTRPLVVIPVKGRACAAWLKMGATVLVEIADPGRVRLLPWQPFGEAVVKRRRELAQGADEEERNELILLTERFRRVHIEKNGRFPLQEREQFHLGLGSDTGWMVLVICTAEAIELWNEQFRRHWRESAEFDEPWLTAEK